MWSATKCTINDKMAVASGAPPVSGLDNTYIEISSLSTTSWYDLWVTGS